ncbi:MAG: SMI1/KNR4 family protein [Pseudomonadales bacterium]|nr:SMI1/KNR4 family protein [Pseudomonadales bacterium]
MVEFINTDILLKHEDIESLSASVGIAFPDALKSLFLKYNGGEPEPYNYVDDVVYLMVNETLPLATGRDRDTAIDVYNDLIVGRKVLSAEYFPFAVDAGGNYFFVDCSKPEAPVYFYGHDSIEPVVNLKVSLDTFWQRLVPEDY